MLHCQQLEQANEQIINKYATYDRVFNKDQNSVSISVILHKKL